jgi:hypothetical protein
MSPRLLLTSAAVAALLSALAAFAPAPASASASFCIGNAFSCRDFGPFSDRNNTNFDLGIDVSNVPMTRAGVNQVMASLSPQGQTIMLHTCQNYLGYPSQVRSPRTIEFCHVLLGR